LADYAFNWQVYRREEYDVWIAITNLESYTSKWR
jgi:hypothetical protein